MDRTKETPPEALATAWSPNDLTSKARIRNAALTLFAQQGEDGTSMRAIATAAGVTVGLVTHHYGTKDGLREAVDTLIVELFAETLRPLPHEGSARLILSLRDEAVAEMLHANPTIIDYLSKRSWTNDTVNKLMAWMSDNQATGEDGAKHFLSENPEFVDAVNAAGLVFIGPSAASIRAMGLKDAAKVLMEKAGVPVVPGYQGDNQDADHLREQAGRIGYPVLIKAVAGGGGKGMRLVERDADFADALASAQGEAATSTTRARSTQVPGSPASTPNSAVSAETTSTSGTRGRAIRSARRARSPLAACA